MNLIEIYENNKKIKSEKQKLEDIEEINEMISCIFKNEDNYYTDNEELLKNIGIKYKKGDYYIRPYYMPRERSFKFELNKTNIKKINDYYNKNIKEYGE